MTRSAAVLTPGLMARKIKIFQRKHPTPPYRRVGVPATNNYALDRKTEQSTKCSGDGWLVGWLYGRSVGRSVVGGQWSVSGNNRLSTAARARGSFPQTRGCRRYLAAIKWILLMVRDGRRCAQCCENMLHIMLLENFVRSFGRSFVLVLSALAVPRKDTSVMT